MHSVMQRIDAIQKHPDTVGCVNFHHKLTEGQGRDGPRRCNTYVFSVKTWVYGEGATAEEAFNDLWRQLTNLIPTLEGPVTVQASVPGLTAQPAPNLTIRIPGL